MKCKGWYWVFAYQTPYLEWPAWLTQVPTIAADDGVQNWKSADDGPQNWKPANDEVQNSKPADDGEQNS